MYRSCPMVSHGHQENVSKLLKAKQNVQFINQSILGVTYTSTHAHTHLSHKNLFSPPIRTKPNFLVDHITI